jgi:tetratricopeptide (TPR) repeat protein
VAWNNLANARGTIAFLYDATGRVSEAITAYRRTLEVVPRASPGLASNFIFLGGRLAVLEAETGARTEGTPEYRKLADLGMGTLPKGSFQSVFLSEAAAGFDRQVWLVLGRYAEAREHARAQLARTQAMKPSNEIETRTLFRGLTLVHGDLAWSAHNLGDFTSAATDFGRAVEYRQKLPMLAPSDRAVLAELESYRALSLARAGRGEEAAKLAETQIKFMRDLISRGSEDLQTHGMSLARASLALGIASPARSRAALAEAAAIMDAFPAEMKRLRTVTQLRGWIAEEAAKRR